MDVFEIFNKKKQSVDLALANYGLELSKLSVSHIAPDTDLTESMILLHSAAVKYFFEHESLFEFLEINRSALTAEMIQYLNDEPVKQLRFVLYDHCKIILSERVRRSCQPDIWLAFRPDPAVFLHITRRIAWGRLSNDEKQQIVAKYRLINVNFQEFADFEVDVFLLHRSNLRNLINKLYKTPEDFDSFIIDRFPEQCQKIPPQWSQESKINTLFRLKEPQEIIKEIEACVGSDRLRESAMALMNSRKS